MLASQAKARLPLQSQEVSAAAAYSRLDVGLVAELAAHRVLSLKSLQCLAA